MNGYDSNLSRRDSLKKTGSAAVICAVSSIAPGLASAAEKIGSDMDVIIRGGLIYDGSSGEPFRADIGIRKDRIVAIGNITGKAGKMIDASGLIVAPGFIDVHTHCDLLFKKSGPKRYLSYVTPSWKGSYNYISQGVTTVVTGNCGWGYTEIDQWFGILDCLGFGTNVCHLTPHGDTREKLFGTAVRTSLSAAELENLKSKIADEISKGAVGFSTGLEYSPGVDTPTDEIIAVAKAVRSKGGIYVTHIRNESGKIMPSGQYGVVEALREAIEIGRRAEIPVEISHLKIGTPINGLNAAVILEIIEKARAEGLQIHADQYPYNASSTMITDLLPKDFISSSGVKDVYKTAEGRKQVMSAIQKVFEYLPPEKTLVTFDSRHPSYEGKNLRELAEIESKTPAFVYAELACSSEPPFCAFFDQDDSIIAQIMPHDYILTASDGFTVPKGMMKPHPRGHGTFTRKIRKYVLEDKVLGLKEAISSMTSVPAQKINLKGRGSISEGNFADIVVIDLNSIRDFATYTAPHQYSKGVEYLLVNGVVSIDRGAFTGERGGRPVER
ncbi:MAG: amidohydrolase family protein [Deltaproteobacteria bacterium]